MAESVALHRLSPLTALGHAAPEVATVGPITIAEVADVGLASVAARRGREADLAARAGQHGIPLPPPGRLGPAENWASFWVGPEAWMVEAPLAGGEDVVARLKPLLGDAASITEQTDAWARLDVAGPLRPLFERLCNLDLDGFGPGSATRTLVEHMGVLMVRRAEDRMTVLGARSAAASLHHALVTAARSAF